MATASSPDHDALYQRLFSHPGVVAQLLRGFVDSPWLADLDLEGMERLNTKFHADTGQRREGDMIWRIPRRDGQDAYLVLLLEFQSTSDHYMALRVLNYAALLWQQLAREERLAPNGALPPLLPVVLYNGDAPWRAPVAVRDLVGLPKLSPLWHWQPDSRYHLIDIGTLSEAELKARDSLPALWFRLENARDTDQVVVIADAVLEWLSQHAGFSAARAAFVELLSAMVAPLGPGVRIPEDLLEVRNMLAARAEKWTQEWWQSGRQEGIEAGRQAGLQAGLQEGRQAGLQEGRQAGEATLLLRLLERRFGALPDSARERVVTAETTILEEWSLRVLEAKTLDEVFADRTA
jgi:predicted transposase YdaD